jgi:hypothetical protein
MDTVLSKLPGPGSYNAIEIIGKLDVYKTNSKLKTPQVNAFPGEARFKVPSNSPSLYPDTALRERAPGPGAHSPHVNFTDYLGTSRHKFIGRAVFGSDERKALDYRHKLFKDVPGPGAYSSFNEFGRYVIEPRLKA